MLKHAEYDDLRVCYTYYNVSTTNRMKEGMSDMLIKAHEMQFDVFNTLDYMENREIIEDLKYQIGDGLLHYYLYNWRVRHMEPSQLAMTLV